MLAEPKKSKGVCQIWHPGCGLHRSSADGGMGQTARGVGKPAARLGPGKHPHKDAPFHETMMDPDILIFICIALHCGVLPKSHQQLLHHVWPAVSWGVGLMVLGGHPLALQLPKILIHRFQIKFGLLKSWPWERTPVHH